MTATAAPVRPAVLAAALLTLGLVAATRAPAPAHAAIGHCRTDPIVTLSNGAVVDLSATIADGAADVRQVAYMLHVPTGTTLVRVRYTGGPFAGRETLAVVADTGAGAYTSTTLVSTGAAGIAVTAQTIVGAQMGAAAGLSGQALTVQVGP